MEFKNKQLFCIILFHILIKLDIYCQEFNVEVTNDTMQFQWKISGTLVKLELKKISHYTGRTIKPSSEKEKSILFKNLTPGEMYNINAEFLISDRNYTYFTESFTTRPNVPVDPKCTHDNSKIIINWRSPNDNYDYFNLAIYSKDSNGSSDFVTEQNVAAGIYNGTFDHVETENNYYLLISTYAKHYNGNTSSDYEIVDCPKLKRLRIYKLYEQDYSTTKFVLPGLVMSLIVFAILIALISIYRKVCLTRDNSHSNCKKINDSSRILAIEQDESANILDNFDDNLKIDQNDIEVLGQIGEGNFGKVYHGTFNLHFRRVSHQVAIKISSIIKKFSLI